jgi:GTP-binding protein HflX
LLVDTVGFIRKLPHALVAAFRATLEEVKDADLLLHVVDASEAGVRERETAVMAVLSEIGAAERPQLLVLNKADRAADRAWEHLLAGREGAIAVSALTGLGLTELKAAVAARLELRPARVRLRFARGERRAIAGVYAAGRVLGHLEDEGFVELDAELPGRLLERYREHVL